MGIFRKSGPDLHKYIQDSDAGGLCFFVLSGTGEERKVAAGAFLRLAMTDPQKAAEGLSTIDENRLHSVAETLIETAGPLHGSVLVLACYSGDGFRKSMVKSMKKRLENPYEDLTSAVRSKKNPAARGALYLLMALGRNAIPYVASLLPELNGEDQHIAACYLKDQEWRPKNPGDIAHFFYLCDDWDGIAKQGSNALPLLRKLIVSDDAGERSRAIHAMGIIKDPSEIPTLQRALSDADRDVRTAAIDALGKYTLEHTGSILRQALSHGDPQVRLNAAWALHHRGWEPRTDQESMKYLIARMEWEKVAGYGKEAIPECSRMIRTRDPEAEGAVRALTMMGETGILALESVTAQLSAIEQTAARDTAQEAINDLNKRREREEQHRREQMEEREKRNREQEAQQRKGSENDPGKEEITRSEIRVLQGLQRLRLKKTAEKKIYEVREGKEKPELVPFEYAVLALESNNPAIRASAVDVLAIMGARAHPYIMRAAGDESPLVRTASAEAMGFLGCSTMLKPLLMLVNDSISEVRTAAVTSLGSFQHPGAIVAVLGLFGDGDADVRNAASRTAALFGKSAYPHLLKALSEGDPHAKISAVGALGELCYPETVPILINYLYDPDSDVRNAVSHAIAVHGGRAVPALTEFAEDAVGDAREAAVAALFEIDPEFAAPFLSLSQDMMNSMMRHGRRGAAAFEAVAGGEPGGSPKNRDPSGQERPLETGAESNKMTLYHLTEVTDADSIVDALVRIEQGDQELSQELLVQMYNSESPFLENILRAFGSSDRNQAYVAANLVDSLGWSPEGGREMFLYRMAKGEIDKVHEAGDEVISPALDLIENLDTEMQKRLIDEIRRVGGEKACQGLATLIGSEDPSVRGAAAVALIQWGPSAIPSLREAESAADERSKRRYTDVIQSIEH